MPLFFCFQHFLCISALSFFFSCHLHFPQISSSNFKPLASFHKPMLKVDYRKLKEQKVLRSILVLLELIQNDVAVTKVCTASTCGPPDGLDWIFNTQCTVILRHFTKNATTTLLMEPKIMVKMEFQFYLCTLITRESAPEPLGDIYTGGMYAWDGQTMVPAYHQALAPTNPSLLQ